MHVCCRFVVVAFSDEANSRLSSQLDSLVLQFEWWITLKILSQFSRFNIIKLGLDLKDAVTANSCSIPGLWPALGALGVICSDQRKYVSRRLWEDLHRPILGTFWGTSSRQCTLQNVISHGHFLVETCIEQGWLSESHPKLRNGVFQLIVDQVAAASGRRSLTTLSPFRDRAKWSLVLHRNCFASGRR